MRIFTIERVEHYLNNLAAEFGPMTIEGEKIHPLVYMSNILRPYIDDDLDVEFNIKEQILNL